MLLVFASPLVFGSATPDSPEICSWFSPSQKESFDAFAGVRPAMSPEAAREMRTPHKDQARFIAQCEQALKEWHSLDVSGSSCDIENRIQELFDHNWHLFYPNTRELIDALDMQERTLLERLALAGKIKDPSDKLYRYMINQLGADTSSVKHLIKPPAAERHIAPLIPEDSSLAAATCQDNVAESQTPKGPKAEDLDEQRSLSSPSSGRDKVPVAFNVTDDLGDQDVSRIPDTPSNQVLPTPLSSQEPLRKQVSDENQTQHDSCKQPASQDKVPASMVIKPGSPTFSVKRLLGVVGVCVAVYALGKYVTRKASQYQASHEDTSTR